MSQPHKLYTNPVDWWHLLSRVEDYVEEAAIEPDCYAFPASASIPYSTHKRASFSW